MKEMIDDFLIIIVGSKFSSSQDYGAQIMFSEKKLTHDLRIKNIFQTKKDNNVWFIIPKQIVTCSKKGPSSNVQGKSIISTQSASNKHDRVKMCDDNKSLSNINPGKPLWRNSDEIFKKDTSPPVINVHQCLRNN